MIGKRPNLCCPSCKASPRVGDRFCWSCGARIDQAASSNLEGSIEALAPQIVVPEDCERKFVTVLFADLVNSTALVDGLDPEDALERLEPALQIMRRAIHRYGGILCKEQGDGVMALFGAPRAEDDHAVHACSAALEIVDSLARLPIGLLGGRAGLHSGEVVARPIATGYSIQYDAAGSAVHLANRLESLARSGTVAVSSATYALARAHFDFKPPLLVTPRGFAHPIEIFEIVGKRRVTRWVARTGRGLSPFVGRSIELDILRVCAARAANGAIQAVTIVAGPGVGKSRLAHEFIAELIDKGWSILEAECESIFRTTPYLTLRLLILSWLGLQESDPAIALESALQARIEELASPPDQFEEALRGLLNLPVANPLWRDAEPALRRRRVVEAMKFVIASSCVARPAAVLIEDLHWIDIESAAVLDEVANRAEGQRLLLIGTTRPERPTLWSGQGHATDLVLPALGREAAQQILQTLVGNDASLDSLKDRILRQVGGVPLFLEEMARRLIDTGTVVGDDGNYRLAVDPSTIGIPSTVQAIIAARVDQVREPAKQLLLCASVIGERISLPLLRAVSEIEETALLDVLGLLSSSDLLIRNAALGEGVLQFSHDLVREVAYSAMLREQRRSLHNRVLRSMVQLAPAQVSDNAETLAYHATQAQDWANVVNYGRLAGTKGIDRSAYQDAAKFLSQAIEALTHLPRDRSAIEMAIDLRLQLRAVFSATSQLNRCIDYAREAEAIACEIGDERRRLTSAVYRAAALNFAGLPSQSIEICENALDRIDAAEHLPLCVLAEYTLGQAHYAVGNFSEAVRVLSRPCERLGGEQALVRLGTPGTTRIMCLSMLAVAHASLGNFSAALDSIADANESTKRTERIYDRIATGYARGVTELYQERAGAAVATLTETLGLCRDHAVSIYVPVVAGQLGCALVAVGQYLRAAHQLRQAVMEGNSLSHGAATSAAKAYLALALTGLGDFDEARELADGALQAARQRGYRGVELMCLRASATLSMRANPQDHLRAEQVLLQMTALGAKIGARPSMALAYSMLGELLKKKGRESEAIEAFDKAAVLYRELGMRLAKTQITETNGR